MSRKRVIVLGVIVLLIIFLPGYSKLRQLRSRNDSLIERIEKLKKENTELTKQVERLENDPLYIEKKARDNMGIATEGELRYKVIYENKEFYE